MVCPQPGATNKAGEQNPALPRAFIQLDAKNRHNVDCTSHELNALNSRLKDATSDCMVLTEQASHVKCCSCAALLYTRTHQPFGPDKTSPAVVTLDASFSGHCTHMHLCHDQNVHINDSSGSKCDTWC